MSELFKMRGVFSKAFQQSGMLVAMEKSRDFNRHMDDIQSIGVTSKAEIAAHVLHKMCLSKTNHIVISVVVGYLGLGTEAASALMTIVPASTVEEYLQWADSYI